jgi:hypothetical protein
MPTIKPFWKSKTFWANLLALAGVGVVAATGADVNVTGEDVDPRVGTAVLAGINLVLRFFTNTGINGGDSGQITAVK